MINVDQIDKFETDHKSHPEDYQQFGYEISIQIIKRKTDQNFHLT